MKPYNGQMVYWRFKASVASTWRFGYCSYTNDYDLVRMGPWNGCDWEGPIVSVEEIEWRKYS